MKELYKRIIPGKPTIHDEILSQYLDQAEKIINKENPEESRKLFLKVMDPDCDVYEVQKESSSVHENVIIFIADVIKTLCYSQRITLHTDLYKNLYMESAGMNHQKLELIKNEVHRLINTIDIPFEETSICMKSSSYTKGLLFNFYRNSDKRIKDGKEEDMWSVKVLVGSEPYMNSMGFEQNYVILTEFNFIKSMLPRLIFFANSNNVCLECSNKYNFLNYINLSRLLNPESTFDDERFKHCLKTNRVYEKCNISTMLSPGNTKVSEAYMILYEIMKVFEKLKNRPKKLSRFINEKKNNKSFERDAFKEIIKGEETEDSPFSIINITDNKEVFEIKRKNGGKHSQHSSPCEHTRQPHIRILRDGRVIHVSGSTINKGKGKLSIIEIK